MKFKIGDKVKVVKSYYDSFDLGQTGVVTQAYENNLNAYDVQQDGYPGPEGDWPMQEDELELIS
jgi:hypothetical protein